MTTFEHTTTKPKQFDEIKSNHGVTGELSKLRVMIQNGKNFNALMCGSDLKNTRTIVRYIHNNHTIHVVCRLGGFYTQAQDVVDYVEAIQDTITTDCYIQI